MEPIVSTPDPGWFDHPRQHSHAAALLVEDLHPYDVQDSELTAELEAMLAVESANASGAAAEEPLLPGFEATTWADLADTWELGNELETDLPDVGCPAWCVEADSGPSGSDAPAYEGQYGHGGETSEHRGVGHSILLAQGAASFGDHDPYASLSVHVEQDRYRSQPPRIVLELTIDDIPHEAYLGAAEAHALWQFLADLRYDAER